MAPNYDSSAAWRPDNLARDKSWVFNISNSASLQLAKASKKAFDPERSFFDYCKDNFDFGAGLDIILAAAQEAKRGKGLSLVKGLPRKGLNEQEFQLVIWGIGLYLGVARTQVIASHYISKVYATGMGYRSASGLGYNSNAGLDFHCDGADLVALACYNKAKNGGKSMVSSSISAWEILLKERPELAAV